MPVTTIIDDVALVRMLATRMDDAIDEAERDLTPRYLWDIRQEERNIATARLASCEIEGERHTHDKEGHYASWQATFVIDVSEATQNIYGPAGACAAVRSIFEGHRMWLGGTEASPIHLAQVMAISTSIQTAPNNESAAMPCTVTLRGTLRRNSLATMQDVI